MYKNKAEHDMYMRVMISNLGHDEASYNLTNRQAFSSREYIPGALLEKIHRLDSSIQEIRYNIEALKYIIDKGEDDTEALLQLERLQLHYKTAMQDLVTGYGITIECFDRIVKGKL